MYKILIIHTYIYIYINIRCKLRERNALITTITQVFNVIKPSHCHMSHVYYTDNTIKKIQVHDQLVKRSLPIFFK